MRPRVERRRRPRRARRQISSGTYSRPRDQSIARSCQKLVSCSAVHTASDAAIELDRRDSR